MTKAENSHPSESSPQAVVDDLGYNTTLDQPVVNLCLLVEPLVGLLPLHRLPVISLAKLLPISKITEIHESSF